MTSKSKKGKKRNFLPLIFFLIIFSIILVSVGIYFKSEFDDIIGIKNEISQSNKFNENDDLDTNFLKAIVPDTDTNERIINVSEYSDSLEFSYDSESGKYIKKVYSGRRINIAVTGVDSRLGDRYKHADANHIISVLLDSGKIEIISIPRDTPADAGYDDTTGQNKLTIVRAAKGRKAYFDELCRIGNLDKIHNYAELGFSQAMGIIEFLGFDNPKETLQILRSRTALGGDDFQRVYNQAQFIRQMLFKNFDRLSGTLGDILIGSGLIILESDMTTSQIKNIIAELKQKNFGSSIENISIRIRPVFPAKFKVYDFSDKSTVNILSNKVKEHFKSKVEDESGAVEVDVSDKVYTRLSNRIEKSLADTLKYPQRIISNLSVFFEQRAWLQISDKEKRTEIRNKFVELLASSYEKRKDTLNAKKIRNVALAEDNLMNNKIIK